MNSSCRIFNRNPSHGMPVFLGLTVFFFLAFGSVASVPLAAQTPVALGPEFQVNSDTALDHHSSDVTPGTSDDVVAVFVGRDRSTGDGYVYGRRLDVQRGFVDDQFQVSSRHSRYHFYPGASVASSGDFLVVWEGFFDSQLRGQRFDAEDNAVGGEFRVTQDFEVYQRVPSIAAGSEGGFLVAWHGEPAIRTRWFHSDGSSLDEQRVDETPADDYGARVDVTAGNSGEYLVVWSFAGAIRGRRVSAFGEPIGSEVEISPEQQPGNRWPQATVSPNGDYLVVWQVGYLMDQDIMGRRLSSTGVPLGDGFQINTLETGNQAYPAVSAGADGDFLVIWESEVSTGTDGEDESIQLRVVSSDGVPLASEMQVNESTLGRQRFPSIATASDGTFVLTWSGPTPDSDRVGIRGRRLALPTALCAEGPSNLCLNQGRFSVEVDWRDFAGQEGGATTVQLDSQDSGLLWFFSENNWEMLIKVLDGCDFNGNFWVFAAATTDVEYTMTVTDTYTGAERRYSNPLGTASPAITDTEAFVSCWANRSTAVPANPAWLSEPTTQHPSLIPAYALDGPKRSKTMSPGPAKGSASCDADDTSLCLNQERFKVEVEWSTAEGDGSGRVDPLRTSDAGLFWFFSPNNLELLVKVLDGCGINDRFWVFSAATTDVEHVLRVTDTVTGAVRTYSNPAGVPAPAITDTDAFACP